MNLNEWLPSGLWPTGMTSPDHIFWVALLLVVGALAGELIARWTEFPRVIGYTAAGFVAAWAGFGPGLPMFDTARLIVDLALALLLFEIGSRVRLRWLRFNPALFWTGLIESVFGAVAVFAVLDWLGVDMRVAVACAILAIPSSAAVAGRVALELGAEGQVTDRMILLTALNTLFAVLAMTLFHGWWHAGQSTDMLTAITRLGASFLGSLLLATLLAALVAAVARRLDLRNESAVLLVLGLVLMAISTARATGLSTLLVPLLAGLILRNSSQRPWVWPRHFGTAGGVLVLILFVIVGSSWSPQILAAGGVAALALVATRLLAKSLSVMVFSHWAGASVRQGFALAITLTPLSATVLVMLSELHSTVPELGAKVAPIMLTAVALLELIGPIAVQLALRLAGELGPARRSTRKVPR